MVQAWFKQASTIKQEQTETEWEKGTKTQVKGIPNGKDFPELIWG